MTPKIRHSKKDVNKALKEIAEMGFTVVRTPGKGQSWGYIQCPFGCCVRKYVWSTPRNPTKFAGQLLKHAYSCKESNKRL